MLFSSILAGFGLVASAATASTPDHHEDWSVNIIESTMSRFTPDTIGTWEYFVSLYLMGQYVVYKRTGEERYMEYIQAWADRWFDDQGKLNLTVDSLDDIQAGNVMLIVYEETGDEKYKEAAQHIRDSFDTYPRISDGAFWHSFTFEHQIWADGTFMANPFLERWGHMFGEDDYTDNESTKQLNAYAHHLQQENGLLIHAYDESREAEWADPVTGLSEEQWCRAMGWYGFAATDLLLLLPENHPSRPELLHRLDTFLSGAKSVQDRKTGRWFQVVNRPDDEENWTETSCSAMFTYTADIALKQGWLKDKWGKYRKMVKRGLAGVLDQVRKNDEGLTDVFEIVVGTNVGNLTHYYNRPRKTNDLHGLGAVLLMNEQVVHSGHITLGE
ncbi:putative di-trans,poly-cis-decaprenylcistransferase [Sarocladium strictum]